MFTFGPRNPVFCFYPGRFLGSLDFTVHCNNLDSEKEGLFFFLPHSIHNKPLKPEKSEITMKEYFGLLDLIYGSGLPAEFQRRLLAVFPKLKVSKLRHFSQNNIIFNKKRKKKGF